MKLLPFIFILVSCQTYNVPNPSHMSRWRANKISKKFNYTQPHKTNCDKATVRRARLVNDHMFHISY